VLRLRAGFLVPEPDLHSGWWACQHAQDFSRTARIPLRSGPLWTIALPERRGPRLHAVITWSSTKGLYRPPREIAADPGAGTGVRKPSASDRVLCAMMQ